jgi:regulatory protein
MRGRPAPQLSSERSTDRDGCREAALRLLERTRRTRSDLTRRLLQKGYDAGTIEGTLERLASVGLVDDVEYARAWLAGRRLRRPAGARRIEMELRTKGVGAEAIAEARARLTDQQGAMDELEGARKVAAQAERRHQGLEPRVRARRLYALLARRGFSSDVIQAALRDPPPDPEP